MALPRIANCHRIRRDRCAALPHSLDTAHLKTSAGTASCIEIMAVKNQLDWRSAKVDCGI